MFLSQRVIHYHTKLPKVIHCQNKLSRIVHYHTKLSRIIHCQTPVHSHTLPYLATQSHTLLDGYHESYITILSYSRVIHCQAAYQKSYTARRYPEFTLPDTAIQSFIATYITYSPTLPPDYQSPHTNT